MSSSEFNLQDGDIRGFILTLASSIACILGSLVICADVLLRLLFPGSKFNLKNNQTFLICSLSLSSGVLVYTSMFKLMPESLEYFLEADLVVGSSRKAQAFLITSYMIGIVTCAGINTIVHAFTSRSVVQCAHGESEAHFEHSLDHGHNHPELQPTSTSQVVENDPSKPTDGQISASKKWRQPLDIESGQLTVNEETPLLVSHQACSADDKPHTHHHISSSRQSDLFSIGLQTAIAISVHKIPEGFLMFSTSRTNPELGFSVFVALAIHNISEGFTIAFPLFMALESRTIAILAAFMLGGLSQPFGALLAWALFQTGLIPGGSPTEGEGASPLVFGFIVSFTAGFLSIIGFQMYGTAVSFGGKPNTTLAWVFIGIAVIGLGSCLTAH